MHYKVCYHSSLEQKTNSHNQDKDNQEHNPTHNYYGG